MIYSNDSFYIDYRKLKDMWGLDDYLCPEEGLTIWRKLTDKAAPIVDVLPDKDKTYYMCTYADNLQTYVTTYEIFVDFIKAVDEAYYRLDVAVASKKLNDFLD